MKKFANLIAALCLLGLSVLDRAHAAQTERAFTPVVRYNLSGQVTGTIAPDPDATGPLKYLATRNTYDSRGLLIKTESGQLSAWLDETILPANWENYAAFSILMTSETTYDGYGRKSTDFVRGTNGSIESLVQYSYGTDNNLRCKAVRMNPAAYSSLPPSACWLGTEGSFGPDRITRYGYDDFDQVVTEERAVGVPGLEQTYVTNEYDQRLLRFQTDAKGNKTELRYDAYGRLKRRVYPHPSAPGAVNEADFNEYTYDSVGNVTIERKRSGATITATYDNNNRPIFKDLSDNTYSADVSYNYDLRGLLLSSKFGSDTGTGEILVYNGFGELTTRNSTLSGSSRPIYYDYDLNGNRSRITHPDGNFFTYEYDGLNRLSDSRSSDSNVPTASTTWLLGARYGADGKRLRIERPGGFNTGYLRDNAHRLDSFTQDLSGTADDLENIFSYNPTGQVVRLIQSNTQYNFREVANRTGVYQPNGLNQYEKIAGQTIGYDTNGNLTTDGTVTYTYDMENRLVAENGTVNGAVVNATFTWDTSGRLFQLTINGSTTQFLNDGDALVAEYSGGMIVRRYFHSGKADEPLVQYNGSGLAVSDRRYLFADHQGSIIAQASNAGGVLAKNAYDPHGIPAAANTGRFAYTGQAWIKELGLYHYKARMYYPKLGRFLQTDPIGYKDSMNLYAYSSEDPLNRRDPSGKYSCGLLTSFQCSTFMAAQHAARRQMRIGVSTLRGIQSKLTKGEKLSSSQQRFADRVSKALGEGAGEDQETLGALVQVGEQMIDMLDSKTPANFGGDNPTHAARANPGEPLMLYSGFFESSARQMTWTTAHEAKHHGARGLDIHLKYGKEYISAYGPANIERQAQVVKDPIEMMVRPDAVVYALGFEYE